MAGVDKHHTARNVGHKCCEVGVIATERRHTSGDVSRIAELVRTANTECCRLYTVLVWGRADSWGETVNQKHALD